MSDDGRIGLRAGLKFDDDGPDGARDRAASIARWTKRDTYCLTLDNYLDLYGVAGGRTIEIALKGPFPPPIDLLGGSFTRARFRMPERCAIIYRPASLAER